jgi:hypothetical protein
MFHNLSGLRHTEHCAMRLQTLVQLSLVQQCTQSIATLHDGTHVQRNYMSINVLYNQQL